MVSIFDIEKDGKLDKFWHGAVKIAFGAALDLLPTGTAITVGNILKALKKKPDDRSDIEKKFDDLIDQSKKPVRHGSSGNITPILQKWGTGIILR